MRYFLCIIAKSPLLDFQLMSFLKVCSTKLRKGLVEKKNTYLYVSLTPKSEQWKRPCLGRLYRGWNTTQLYTVGFFFINHDIRIPWWTNQDDSWKVGPRFFGPWPKSGLVTGGTKKAQPAVPALRSIPGSFQAFIFPDHRDVKARNQGSFRAIRYSGFFGVRGPWVPVGDFLENNKNLFFFEKRGIWLGS